ncbi:ATP-binding protein [Aeromicrobium erythreum]|nr:ATP-binding protein [Aeromicrobium erythreum]
MRSYSMLSDHDFELLVCAILQAERDGNVRWEVFARGRDRGVDVRRLGPAGLEVVQCKHMLGSTFPQLRSSANDEKKKLDVLSSRPKHYEFWTTMSLTSANKAELKSKLSPWIKSESDIWGREDIELALNRNPDVERGHVKLWIAGAGQLSAQLHAGIWERSRELASEVEATMSRYVETGVFHRASEMLDANKVLVISGPPGVGKTTIARLLVAQAASRGFEPVLVSADIDEAHRVLDREKKQIFYYDDFLGSNFLSNRLDKNEDKRLASFIRSCRQNENSLFVMTTREYILRQALADYEELERVDVHLDRLIIELDEYTRVERARILYNHIFHSPHLHDSEALTQLREGQAYLRLIDHPNYNPRLIEFATYTDPSLRAGVPADFAAYIKAVFDNPDSVWRAPFESQVESKGQALVMLLACLPGAVSESVAYELINAAASSELCDASRPGDLERMLRVLDDSFIATSRDGAGTGELLVRLRNPSIADFVAGLLVEEQSRRTALIGSLSYFEQAVWVLDSVRDRLRPGEIDNFDRLVGDALLKLFDRPAPNFGLRFVGLQSRVGWSYSSPAVRLLALQRAASVSAVCRESLSTALNELTTAEAERWAKSTEDFDELACAEVVDLLEAVGKESVPEGVWTAARDLLDELPPSAEKWDLLNRLSAEDANGSDYLGRHSWEFESWFNDLLDNSLEYLDLDELEQARELAEFLGVRYDEGLFESIQTELAGRADEIAEHRAEEWRDRGDQSDDREVSAIFDR